MAEQIPLKLDPTAQSQPTILIGTSGYSYAAWRKVFYPPKLPKWEYLRYYQEYFDFCELNFTYYRLPTAKQMQRYAQTDLTFAVKAHRSTTHERENEPQGIEELKAALVPLKETGTLGAVLVQFPYSFHHTVANRDYLQRVLEGFGDLPIAVEFRNPYWAQGEVFELLDALGVGYVVTDAPPVEGAMPTLTVTTGGIGYIRFHGRNRAQWWTGDNVTRYEHEYTDEELKEWLPRIKEMARQAQRIYVAFNNHAQGYAVKNALRLKELLNT